MDSTNVPSSPAIPPVVPGYCSRAPDTGCSTKSCLEGSPTYTVTCRDVNVANNVANNVTNNVTNNPTNNPTNNLTNNLKNNPTNDLTNNVTNNVTNNLTNKLTNNVKRKKAP